MAVLFFILIIIACIVLAFFVLIQNPEGGGLSSSIGGFSNQIMGVKKTNNVLERGTWLFVSIVGLLCIISVFIFSGKSNVNDSSLQQLNNTGAPAQQAPAK
ncbi:MAG: preprotein translocase subunit SecG [Arachidicoccus sp.]|nr:preprotein translocase subunit SecG [Arachidicoccus sp.]